jgi:uncharacterized protein (DUF1800 family)
MTNEIAIAANRFGLGIRPSARPAGKAANWLAAQMDRYDPRPAVITALPNRQALVTALQDLRELTRERRAEEAAADAAKREADAAMVEKGFNNHRNVVRQQYAAAINARLQVAVSSEQDFAERLVHFWSNHFAISIDKNAVVGLAGNYEFEAIRPHIFGKFGDMLKTAVHHPAMLLYLDQLQSIGPDSPLATRIKARRGMDIGLNENLAREILELHTLGVRTVYTQNDVTEFAKALTGWIVGGLTRGPAQRFTDANALPGDSVFVDAIHQPGARTVIGRSYTQSGAAQSAAILADLATHPATAKHIATKLARHFVSDSPPASLIAKLEKDFLKTGGDLKSLYRTLMSAPEAWAAQTPKFKSPWDWVVSSLRAMNVAALPNTQQASGLFVQMGQPIWRPESPAGFGDMTETWTGPAAIMRRVETAGRFAKMAGGRIDARALAPQILPGTLEARTAEHIARAESPEQGLALLLVAPEFLRR